MNTYLLLKTSLRSLRKHKMRSLLTTLGIIIGVISIISVLSIGEGAKYKVRKEIEGIGTNFMILLAGEPKHKTMGPGTSVSLKKKDLKAIREECDDIYQSSPSNFRPMMTIHGGSNWKTLVIGVEESYFDIRRWALTEGEYFTIQDERSSNKVAILGQTPRKELFKNKDPIGKTIKIKGLPFKIVGVLDGKGKTPQGMDQDDTIFVPFSTFQKKLTGLKGISAIIMSAKTKERMSPASRQIRSVLRQSRRLQPGEEDDFTLFTQDDIAQAAEAASKVLNLLLIIIASISLLVGGIGIMNIMLVTVTERTKEIGIRMALGATTNMILNQFILEAITICLIGGLLGLGLGILLAKSVGFFLGWPIAIALKPVVISLTSSILVGLFFGYYPAYQASQLNPVEALVER